MDQAFSEYVASSVGSHERDRLFSHPENPETLQSLQGLGDAFLHKERENLIANVGSHSIEGLHQRNLHKLETRSQDIEKNYQQDMQSVQNNPQNHPIGIVRPTLEQFKNTSSEQIAQYQQKLHTKEKILHEVEDTVSQETSHKIEVGTKDAKRGVAWHPLRHSDDEKP